MSTDQQIKDKGDKEGIFLCQLCFVNMKQHGLAIHSIGTLNKWSISARMYTFIYFDNE